MKIQLGWKAGTEQYPPEQLLDFAIAAERAGFDSVDVSDHFHPWTEGGQACFAWTWLGAAAVKTERIILGTGVTCPILRYHPAIIAQAAATLGRLAPGRVFLGVGTGEALNEYAATGVWPPYNTRRAQMVEAIQLMRELWKGDAVTHRGEHYQTAAPDFYTRSDSPVPLYISALAPNSARTAGRYGDGLITVGGEALDHDRAMLENFAAGAREAGKNPDALPRIIELAADFTDDEAQAIATRKEYWAGVFIPALFTEKIYTPKMSETNGQAVGADIIRDTVCISADPSVHVKFAKRYIDLVLTI